MPAPRNSAGPAGSAVPESSAPRDRIVAEARRHFFAHGFRGITMDDLATELGMSKKTLYAHFPTKTALLEAVVLHKFAEVDGEMQAALERCDGDVGKALHALIATMQQQVAEVQPAFVRDVQREAPEIFALIQSRRQAMIQQHFGRLLAQGQKTGLVRRDLRPALITDILLGAVEAVANPAKLSKLRLEPKAALAAILKVVLEGALTAEGREKL